MQTNRVLTIQTGPEQSGDPCENGSTSAQVVEGGSIERERERVRPMRTLIKMIEKKILEEI